MRPSRRSGARLRERRGQYAVELDDGRRQREVQAALKVLGLDVADVAARLTKGETVTLEVPAVGLPLALMPSTWAKVVFEREVPARALFAELVRDPNALLLWHGALALDPSTRRFFEAAPELIPHRLPRGGAAVLGLQRPRRGARGARAGGRRRARAGAVGGAGRCVAGVARRLRPPVVHPRRRASGRVLRSGPGAARAPASVRDRRVDGRRRPSPRSVPGPLRRGVAQRCGLDAGHRPPQALSGRPVAAAARPGAGARRAAATDWRVRSNADSGSGRSKTACRKIRRGSCATSRPTARSTPPGWSTACATSRSRPGRRDSSR